MSIKVLHSSISMTMLKLCKDQAIADASRLESKMRERLEWSDIKVLRALLVNPRHLNLVLCSY